MIVSFLFLALAAACNAVMDKSVHHYPVSKFKKLNPLFWNGEISWKNKYINGDPKLGRVKWYFGLNKPVQLTDAFHMFKMFMVINICVSIITFDKSFLLYGDNYTFITFALLMLLYGVIWNTTFSLFYKKILK
jgi:hypothetical protein